MKGITCCGDCGYYNWQKHKCSRGCKDEGTAQDHFYKDCPMPDVQPISQWIPCSERLPEEYKSYIVTIKMKYDHEKEYEYQVDVADYNDDNWTTFNDWYEGQDEFQVIAWMPLPEAYKEGAE